jgi:hypothetical protein
VRETFLQNHLSKEHLPENSKGKSKIDSMLFVNYGRKHFYTIGPLRS